MKYFWLILILLFAFLVRLYKIDSPIADWHSWRQADTAAVTRNFVKEGFNPLYPKYDDMSGVAENPIINPGRFRFVEFPVYNIFVHPLYLLFGVSETLHRLVSVLFSLGSIAFLYFICKKYLGEVRSLFSAAIFAFLPFNVFFSRTTLPEPTFVFFALGMVYYVDRWIESNKNHHALLGFIFTAIAFLIKPWAIFFYLPLLYSLYLKKDKKFSIKFLVLSLLALLPFVLWRLWILQQSQGIPASGWLLNGDGIRFRPAFWWWIISERMGREILGATGIILFFIGLLLRPKNGNYFLHCWLLSTFLFMAVVATGNVRHNYYQTLFMPIGSIFLAQGFIGLFKLNSLFIPRFWTVLLAPALLLMSFYFTYKIDKEFYKINNPAIIAVGQRADLILPTSAVVLAPYNGDTAFLYQTNRPGFAAEMLPMMELVADYGVTSYVSTVYDDRTKYVMEHFEILERNKDYVIADLTKLKISI